MLKFDTEQISKYFTNEIKGTGFLAFRDIEYFFCHLNQVDVSHVLDLGCGTGRSTSFLTNFCDHVVGCDISEESVNLAAEKYSKIAFFTDHPLKKRYQGSSYNTIFSILMFFHLSSIQEIDLVLEKCYESLTNNGHLCIVHGTKNLYTENFCSIQHLGDPPKKEGELASLILKTINCTLTDYFWTEKTIITAAQKIGFKLGGLHFPMGTTSDGQPYIDEFYYPPYFYLLLQK